MPEQQQCTNVSASNLQQVYRSEKSDIDDVNIDDIQRRQARQKTTSRHTEIASLEEDLAILTVKPPQSSTTEWAGLIFTARAVLPAVPMRTNRNGA